MGQLAQCILHQIGQVFLGQRLAGDVDQGGGQRDNIGVEIEPVRGCGGGSGVHTVTVSG